MSFQAAYSQQRGACHIHRRLAVHRYERASVHARAVTKIGVQRLLYLGRSARQQHIISYVVSIVSPIAPAQLMSAA